MTISIIGSTNQSAEGNPFYDTNCIGTSNISGNTVVTGDFSQAGYDFSLVQAGDCILVLVHMLSTGYISGSSAFSNANIAWHRVMTSPAPGSGLNLSTEWWIGLASGTVSGISFSFTAPPNSIYCAIPSAFVLRSSRGSPQWGYPATASFFAAERETVTSSPVILPALTPGAGNFAAWEFTNGAWDVPVSTDPAHYTVSFGSAWQPGGVWPSGFSSAWIRTASAQAGSLAPGYTDDYSYDFPVEQFTTAVAITDVSGSLVPFPAAGASAIPLPGFARDGRDENPRVYPPGAEKAVERFR